MNNNNVPYVPGNNNGSVIGSVVPGNNYQLNKQLFHQL